MAKSKKLTVHKLSAYWYSVLHKKGTEEGNDVGWITLQTGKKEMFYIPRNDVVNQRKDFPHINYYNITRTFVITAVFCYFYIFLQIF